MTDAPTPSFTPKFYCEKCDFSCCKTSEWDRHSSTRKHRINMEYLQKTLGYTCACGRSYKHRQSLFTHKQKCQGLLFEKDAEEPVEKTQAPLVTNEMIMNLIDQNKELQKQLVELSKQNTVINHNNTTNHNTMNNQFNLNVFLNEECKDALNIADFIESLKITVTDL